MDLYRNRLEQADFRTVAAVEAQEAFAALAKVAADLIIVDLMSPKAGGFELLKAIRSDSRHRETPVLVLSNAYLPEMAQEALRVGGNKALISSECTTSELISVSRELVGMAEASVNDPSDASEGPDATRLAEPVEKDLLEEGSAEVAAIRRHYSQFVEFAGSGEAKEHLDKLYRSIRLLGTRGGLEGWGRIGQLTGAIEAMLFEEVSRSYGAMSSSRMRTLAKAVDCLGGLFTSGDTGSAEFSPQARVLLVDDDEIGDMAIEAALKRANYDAVSATDGLAALNLLNDHHFDLVLLDIDMPGMNGVEACQKLRCIPHHENTPVIFFTPETDFQDRLTSVRREGDDLISKPISPLELIVKATVLLWSTSQGTLAEQAKPEPRPNKPHWLQSAVKEKLNYLRQTLAEETKRREAVEQQAAENAKRRTELEAAIEENQRSQQWFQQLLEESQQQALAPEEVGQAGQLNLSGRRRALVEVHRFVADKLIRLRQALAEETKRREAVEEEIAENAERRTELETALGEIQRVQDAFQQEADTAANPKRVLELESSLAASQQRLKTLEGELDAARRKLQALRRLEDAQKQRGPPEKSEQSELEARTQELQAAQAELEAGGQPAAGIAGG